MEKLEVPHVSSWISSQGMVMGSGVVARLWKRNNNDSEHSIEWTVLYCAMVVTVVKLIGVAWMGGPLTSGIITVTCSIIRSHP
jgi:hypothetical protein